MIPDPLHPAVVHFPIVLLIAGFVLAAMVLIRSSYSMAIASAIILTLATIGSQVALMTGEKEEDAGERASRAVLEKHEEAAELTRWLALGAALAAVGTVIVQKKRPAMVRPAAAATTLISLAAVGAVVWTAHQGGLLVYQHGAGVRSDSKLDLPRGKAIRHHDDDD